MNNKTNPLGEPKQLIISSSESSNTVTLHLWDKDDVDNLIKIGEELQKDK